MDSNKPMVSVLTTIYNREDYLAEAIESVIFQTFANWELILVDDGSTDSSYDIASDYANRDCRIKAYRNPRNLGDYPNRNKAASYARGKYIKYLDADDLLYPWALETYVSSMEQFPDAGWGMSFKENGIKPYPYLLQCEEIYEKQYNRELSILTRSPLSTIIKTDVFHEVGGFSGRQHIGDFEMWHTLANRYPLVAVAGNLGWWREHVNQQSNDNRTDPFIPFKYLKSELDFLSQSECPIADKLKDKYIEKAKKSMGRNILKMILTNNRAKAKQMLDHSELGFASAMIYGFKSFLK